MALSAPQSVMDKQARLTPSWHATQQGECAGGCSSRAHGGALCFQSRPQRPLPSQPRTWRHTHRNGFYDAFRNFKPRTWRHTQREGSRACALALQAAHMAAHCAVLRGWRHRHFPAAQVAAYAGLCLAFSMVHFPAAHLAAYFNPEEPFPTAVFPAAHVAAHPPLPGVAPRDRLSNRACGGTLRG